METKKKKLEMKEDRISDLPDDMIEHIISLLPSTKEAIQTGILSKRWKNQWTQLPNLIFYPTGLSEENYLNFIHDALILHKASKLNKFHLDYPISDKKDPHFAWKIQFATRKYVEDLYLNSAFKVYKLPNFFFDNASLLKLRTVGYTYMPKEKVNWGCLRALNIENCRLSDQTLASILSGSLLLESLELTSCGQFDNLVIASESMKTLILRSPWVRHRDYNTINSVLEISCPKLEKLELLDAFNFKTAKLLDLTSLVSATIDFNYRRDGDEKSLVKHILQQLQHVKELSINSWFVLVLFVLELRGQFSQVMNIKSLTLNQPDLYDHNYYGVAFLLRSSPVLERLVINLPPCYEHFYDDYGKNYWNSNANVFDCLVSHLKTIEIIGFPKRDYKGKLELSFVRFLLKNARVLEKMIVGLNDYGTTSPLTASEELLSWPRCSQNIIVELL